MVCQSESEPDKLIGILIETRKINRNPDESIGIPTESGQSTLHAITARSVHGVN
jgi:hypothetical protein